MRIGYLCPDAEVDVLGQEGCSIHIRELTNALVGAGHEVFIACAWAGRGPATACQARIHEIAPRGVGAEAWSCLEADPRVRELNLERDLRSMLANTWLLDVGAELVARERPDFLYERLALFGWGGVELARRHRIPLILEVNAPLCQEQAGYSKFALPNTAARLEAEILRRADAVVAVSSWLARWVESRGVDPARIRVIPNGVSGRFLAEDVKGDGVRERLGLHGRRVVGFVGSFHWWHDVRGLLEAFTRLAHGDPDLRLLLVGDGEKRRALERRAAELGLGAQVLFAGKVPHPHIPEYLAAMDVAVVPYGPLDDFYFSPLKLFECMALGRPTVAAAIGQIPEVVEHLGNGWLYPPGGVDELAMGIETLLREPELAGRLGREARRTVQARHTWRAVAQEVTSLAGGLLEGRAAERREP